MVILEQIVAVLAQFVSTVSVYDIVLQVSLFPLLFFGGAII